MNDITENMNNLVIDNTKKIKRNKSSKKLDNIENNKYNTIAILLPTQTKSENILNYDVNPNYISGLQNLINDLPNNIKMIDLIIFFIHKPSKSIKHII